MSCPDVVEGFFFLGQRFFSYPLKFCVFCGVPVLGIAWKKIDLSLLNRINSQTRYLRMQNSFNPIPPFLCYRRWCWRLSSITRKRARGVRWSRASSWAWWSMIGWRSPTVSPFPSTPRTMQILMKVNKSSVLFLIIAWNKMDWKHLHNKPWINYLAVFPWNCAFE